MDNFFKLNIFSYFVLALLGSGVTGTDVILEKDVTTALSLTPAVNLPPVSTSLLINLPAACVIDIGGAP